MAASRTVLMTHTDDQHYSIDFFGEKINVTVTKASSEIREWIRNVHRRLPLVVGVGVQWTKYDRIGGYFHDDAPAEILQLCVGKECIIIQLCHLDEVPDELRTFLTDQQTYRFVGIRNENDARKLAESHHHLEIRQLQDIRNYLSHRWGRNVMNWSLEDIVEKYMGHYQGMRLDPERDRRIVWSVNKLELSQILQASLDAYVCCEIGFRFRRWAY